MSKPSPRKRKRSPRQQACLEQARYMHTELKAGRIPYPDVYSQFNVFINLYDVLHTARATEADLGTTEKKLHKLYLTLHHRWLRNAVRQLRKATLPEAPLSIGAQMKAALLPNFISMEGFNPARAGTSTEELQTLLHAMKLKEIERNFSRGLHYLAQGMSVMAEVDTDLAAAGATHMDLGNGEDFTAALQALKPFFTMEEEPG